MANLFTRIGQVFSLALNKEKRHLLDNILTGSSNLFLGGYNDAEMPVNVHTGERITTVFSCINVISQDVSVQPWELKQETADKGKITKSNSILHKLLSQRANPYMNAVHWRYLMTFLGESRGESFSWIERNENYQPIALWPIKPGEVKMIRDEKTGKWFADIRGQVFDYNDIFHYKTFSIDGVNGISKITWNAQNIGLKMKTHKYKSHIIGSNPQGYITAKTLNMAQAKDVANSWKSNVDNGKTPFLVGESEYKHLMFSPEQTDIITSEKWTDVMTWSIWRMQPVMVSMHEDSNYSNSQHQDLIHTKYTLSMSVEAFEQEANNKLLSERQKNQNYYTKINLKGLLRGDIEARTKMYQTLRTLGISDANTILDMEDMPWQDGDKGKRVYIQGAMVDVDEPDKSVQGSEKLLDDLERMIEGVRPKNGNKALN